MINKLYKFLSSILLIALIFPIACSCSPNSTYSIVMSSPGYKTVTIEGGIARFSFEYSIFYQDMEGPNLINDKYSRLTSIRLKAPIRKASMMNPDPLDKSATTVIVSYVPAYIHILVYDARDRGASAREDLDNILLQDDISVLDRSPITVSGIPGEQAYYVSNSLLPLRPSPGEEKPAQYSKSIYFDYGGLIWIIETKYELALADQVKTDFEHVIQTFRILD